MCSHIGYLLHLISYMTNLIIEKLLYDNNMCHIGYNIIVNVLDDSHIKKTSPI